MFQKKGREAPCEPSVHSVLTTTGLFTTDETLWTTVYRIDTANLLALKILATVNLVFFFAVSSIMP